MDVGSDMLFGLLLLQHQGTYDEAAVEFGAMNVLPHCGMLWVSSAERPRGVVVELSFTMH